MNILEIVLPTDKMITLEIVKKIHNKAFQALPKRWIVERTFAWLNLYRRHFKDYE